MAWRKNEADELCLKIAAECHNVIGRADALRAGQDRFSLRRRLNGGDWTELFPRAFLLGAPERPSWSQYLAAACTSVEGVAFRRSAAALHRFPDFRRRELEVVTTGKAVNLAPVSVHRTRYLPDDHITTVDGISTTTPARTLLDVCGLLDVKRARALTLALIDADILTPSEIHEVLGETGRCGRPGSAVCRAVANEVGVDEELPASHLEDRAFEIIVKNGFPAPVRQWRVEVDGVLLGRADLGYPRLWVGIEADGWDSHRSKTRFVDDRSRQNGLVSHGALILRFTARDEQRPRRFLTELDRTLELAGRLVDAGIHPYA